MKELLIAGLIGAIAGLYISDVNAATTPDNEYWGINDVNAGMIPSKDWSSTAFINRYTMSFNFDLETCPRKEGGVVYDETYIFVEDQAITVSITCEDQVVYYQPITGEGMAFLLERFYNSTQVNVNGRTFSAMGFRSTLKTIINQKKAL